MQNPLDKNVLQKGTLLGVVFLFLFFTGVGVVYLFSGLTGWGQVERLLLSLFLGPVLAVIGIVIFWMVKKPTLGA
jgi:hypothetical protein